MLQMEFLNIPVEDQREILALITDHRFESRFI